MHCDFQEAVAGLVNNVNTVNDVNSLVDKPWHLYFDGSRSNEGAGVGCMLLDPEGNKFMLSFDWNLFAQTTRLNMKPLYKDSRRH